MKHTAVRLEEHLLNLFPDAETEIYEGWIMKKLGSRLYVCPLYNTSFDHIDERIRHCEEISRRKNAHCIFRVIEQTNYYLNSRLEKCSYGIQNQATVATLPVTEELCSRLPVQDGAGHSGSLELVPSPDGKHNETVVVSRVCKNAQSSDQELCHRKNLGIKRGSLLFLFDGNNCGPSELAEILHVCLPNQITMVIADFPGCKCVPELYLQYGFQPAYTYFYFQKEACHLSQNDNSQ